MAIEQSNIAEKTAVMAEWQNAIEALKEQDITQRLFVLAKQKPISFRRLLSLVFELNSLRVRTERHSGWHWRGVLEGYTLTDEMQEMATSLKYTVTFDKSTCHVV